jgi:hypothetical protein
VVVVLVPLSKLRELLVLELCFWGLFLSDELFSNFRQDVTVTGEGCVPFLHILLAELVPKVSKRFSYQDHDMPPALHFIIALWIREPPQHLFPHMFLKVFWPSRTSF